MKRTQFTLAPFAEASLLEAAFACHMGPNYRGAHSAAREIFLRRMAREFIPRAVEIAVDQVEEWVKTAELAELLRVAETIKGHVRELNAQLEGSTVQ